MKKSAAKDICKMRMEGELTIYTASATKALLMPVLEKCSNLEIDLSQVSEMDTSGLQLLMLAKRECVARKGNMNLTGHTQAVLDVLDLCNMSQYFGDPVWIASKAH